MNMEEYFRALETYVASRKLNLGDGGAVLSLLYEAYGDVNRIYDDQIKADFAELYQALNGMVLFMACRLVSDWHRKYKVQNSPYTTPGLQYRAEAYLQCK